MELGIRKVGNGFLCEVPGKEITREVQSMFGTQQVKENKVHQFVFSNEDDLYIFLHHLFYPTAELDRVTNKETKRSKRPKPGDWQIAPNGSITMSLPPIFQKQKDDDEDES